MTQQRSPRRFRTIRHVAALAVLAIGGTVLASSPASAANADGVTVGCERDPNLASSILGVIGGGHSTDDHHPLLPLDHRKPPAEPVRDALRQRHP